LLLEALGVPEGFDAVLLMRGSFYLAVEQETQMVAIDLYDLLDENEWESQELVGAYDSCGFVASLSSGEDLGGCVDKEQIAMSGDAVEGKILGRIVQYMTRQGDCYGLTFNCVLYLDFEAEPMPHGGYSDDDTD